MFKLEDIQAALAAAGAVSAPAPASFGCVVTTVPGGGTFRVWINDNVFAVAVSDERGNITGENEVRILNPDLGTAFVVARAAMGL